MTSLKVCNVVSHRNHHHQEMYQWLFAASSNILLVVFLAESGWFHWQSIAFWQFGIKLFHFAKQLGMSLWII